MVTFIPQGPWTYELNWDLCTEYTGEVCIPFHLSVQQQDTSTKAKNFPQFMQLPTELQLSVLRFCDSAVLFQLMRVSSYMRKEAQKLFWSYPDVWYRIQGNWILAGGFPGHTDHDLDFLARVTHVEVKFEGAPLAHNAWDDGEQQWARRPPAHIRDQQIRKFWQTLHSRFPCATNVVLSGTSRDAMDEPAPPDFIVIAEQCPAHIRPSISCRRHETGHPQRATRVLWRKNISQSAIIWEAVDLSWTRQSVIPPPRRFTGPVGAFYRMLHHRYLSLYRQCARRILFIQATEAHYLHEIQGPCVCPAPECHLQFELPGQWAVHAIDSRHDYEGSTPSQHFKALFDEHEAKLACLDQGCADTLKQMRMDWGEEGSEQRKGAEHAFLAQLHDDPSYAHEKPPKECAIWQTYQQKMNKKLNAYRN